MERYTCIHGHFYQPPRENTWLESVERQKGACPYHDWNEKITAECYAANAWSRLLDRQGQIEQMVNNYSKISFNFGPTLLTWLEEKAPEVYEKILEADRESQKHFGGHGSALAQAYNHLIMPLASRRDKCTQIFWGIKDFQRRFGRMPEGMWLPETAVDLESLDTLAQSGIKFTILAPHQAKRVCQIGTGEWKELSQEKIESTQAYELNLPSGRRISLFFYDGPISRGVAFERLLEKGEYLVDRLLKAFSEKRSRPQLVHIATDGETYGHHHRFGDMALAYALNYIESSQLARLTNYGEFLEKNPPAYEVEISENSSWSCPHGTERWRKDCGCNTGLHPEWNQAWRAPLREALDWLRDTVSPFFEQKANQYFQDPWAARNDYIELILDRSEQKLRQFLKKHAKHQLNQTEQTTALKLLELQRNALLMYTSCGWFFDDLTGIETIQILQYAARVIQLSEELFDKNLDPGFLELLSQAKSNRPEYSDGRKIYQQLVRPGVLNLTLVGAHYAVSSLFENYLKRVKIYCYEVDQEGLKLLTKGGNKLALGKIKVTSTITNESARLSLGMLSAGNFDFYGGVREFNEEQTYQRAAEDITSAFNSGNLPELIRLVGQNFGSGIYPLKLLFRDDQHRIIKNIIVSALSEEGSGYQKLYHQHILFCNLLTETGFALSRIFQMAAEVVLDPYLQKFLTDEEPDAKRLSLYLEEVRQTGIKLKSEHMARMLQKIIEESLRQLENDPADLDILKKIEHWLSFSRKIPSPVNLWNSQNIFHRMLKKTFPGFRQKTERGDSLSKVWVEQFQAIGMRLSVKV